MANRASHPIALLAALLVALTLPAPTASAGGADASFCAAACCAASPDASSAGAAETPNHPCGAWGAGIVRAACIAPACAPQSFIPALLQLSSAYLLFGRLLL